MSDLIKGRAGAITPTGMSKDSQHRKVLKDYDRGVKRQVGIIREIDARRNGKLFVFVDVPDGQGGRRPFGQDKTPVVIVDSPLDILLRFGGLRVGQQVEIFYRGVGESGQASARLLADENAPFENAQEKPREGFTVNPSLPFEPFGFI